MLDFLQNEGYIIKISDTYGTHINICNYDTYQTPDTYRADTGETQVQRLCNGSATQVRTNNNDNNDNNVKNDKKYSPNSFEIRMSELLYNLILERNPKQKKPDMQKWAVFIDRMKRLDNRTEEEIEGAIRWCQNDEFWQNNILSTDKLKKQFDKLYLRAKGGKTRQGIDESELREAARIIANDPDLK